MAFLLRVVLSKLKFSKRLVKWLVKLGEFDISFQHMNALKSQVLVDFMAKLSKSEAEL